MWLEVPPEGCRVGSSGPTMVPSQAARLAHRRGLASLLEERGGLRVRAALADSQGRGGVEGVRSVAVQTQVDRLGGFGVAGVWIDVEGVGRDARQGAAHVLICPAGARSPVVPGGGPAWTQTGTAGDAAGWCAVGTAAAALEDEEQMPSAEADARYLLGLFIEAQVDIFKLDDSLGRDGIEHSVLASPTPRAERLTAPGGDAQVTRRWLDTAGEGPFRRMDMAYVQVCMPASAVN